MEECDVPILGNGNGGLTRRGFRETPCCEIPLAENTEAIGHAAIFHVWSNAPRPLGNAWSTVHYYFCIKSRKTNEL